MTIRSMCRKANKIATEKGWHQSVTPVPFPTFIALCHSELSEALEAFRCGSGLRDVEPGPDGKPEGIPIELADVLIRIGDYCEEHSIDLETAVMLKMDYNRTRTHRHGGKVC